MTSKLANDIAAIFLPADWRQLRPLDAARVEMVDEQLTAFIEKMIAAVMRLPPPDGVKRTMEQARDFTLKGYRYTVMDVVSVLRHVAREAGVELGE